MTTLFLDLEGSSLRSPSPFYRDFSRGLFFNFFAFDYYSVSKINPLNFFGHLVNFYMRTFSLFKTRHHSFFTKDQPQYTFSHFHYQNQPFPKDQNRYRDNTFTKSGKNKTLPLTVTLTLYNPTPTPPKLSNPSVNIKKVTE